MERNEQLQRINRGESMISMGDTSITPINNVTEALERKTMGEIVRSSNDPANTKAEIMAIIITALEKCAVALGIDMSKEQKKYICEDLFELYQYDSIEDLLFVLKKGRQGLYGKVYGRLNMIVIGEWMAKHLHEKAIAREQKLQEEKRRLEQPAFNSREEYVQWVNNGMKNQAEIDKLKEEIRKRRLRITGNDPAFEAEVMRIKMELKRAQQKDKDNERETTEQ